MARSEGTKGRFEVYEDFLGFFGGTMGTTALPIGMNGVMYSSVNEGSFDTTVDEPGGVLKITTDTADNDNCCLYIGPFKIADGGCWMEWRGKMADITTDALFIGFQTTVNATTPVMGVEYATATLTVNEAASLAGMLYDKDATTARWLACVTNDGAAKESSPVECGSQAPVNDEYDVVRVDLDSSGGGEIWLALADGSLKQRLVIPAGTLTTGDLVYAVAIIENRSAAASIIEVDYFNAGGNRDWTR